MPACPACAEQIPASAETCPHCGIDVHHDSSGGGPAGAKKSSGLMVVLMVAGGAFGVLVICGGILAALLLPAIQSAREAARRSQCMNNLKQIGLALHNYHDANGSFPPAYIADASGTPMHSWRVLILPYLEERALYNEYDFSEPWDGPNNSRLATRMPRVFACPSDSAASTTTDYAGVLGEHCVFRGTQSVSITAISDGTSNTLLVGEAVGAKIPWMKPADIDIDKHPALGDPDGFTSNHAGGVNFLHCDASVRFISLSVNPQTLRALYTRDGNEVPGSY
jgi:type II secretory pathway pseudopilin PulG